MKKVLLSLTMMLMVAFSGFAEEVTVLTNETASEWTGDANGFSTTISGLNISYTKGSSNAVAPSSDCIKVYKDATLKIQCVDGAIISGVTMNCTQGKYCKTMTVGKGFAKADNTALTISWKGSTEVFEAKADSGQVRIKTITVTYGAAPTVSTPTLNPTSGVYYNPVEVAVACATEGATLHYTTDGTEPTATSTQLTGKVNIDKTTTLKVVAVKGTDVSAVVTGNYVIKSVVKVASVADFLKKAISDKVEFTCPLTVVYQNGWSMFVQDAANTPLLIFGDVAKTYKNGDVIPAGVQGLVDEFGGHLQLSNPEKATFADATAGTPIEPVVVTAATLNVENHYNRLVVVKGATLSSIISKGKVYYTVTDAEGAVVNSYNKFKLETAADSTKTYDVLGIGSEHNKEAQIFLVSFNEVSVTGIETVESDIQVWAGDYSVVVNTVEATDVVVYNVVGEVVGTASVQGRYEFPVNPGLYLVRTSNKVFRALVK